MMDELDKIVIVKEGHGYTTYINDVHCGWGDLEDTLEVFLDYDTGFCCWSKNTTDVTLL